MNTLSDLGSRNVFSFSLVLQELVEVSFEFIDEFYLFKVLFELVDSHDGDSNYFFVGF